MALQRGKKAYLQGEVIFDVTDTTATASDVAEGKIFYDADGVRTEGTATVGGYSINDWLKKNVVTEITAEDLAGITTNSQDSAKVTGLLEDQEALTTVTIPNTFTFIPQNFCFGCSNLTTFNFAESPIDTSSFVINDGAFESCFELVEITIPSYVTSISSSAFRYDAKLNIINYGSTQANWNTISGGVNFFTTTNAVVHCTDGDIYFNVPVGNVVLTYSDNSTENIPTGALMGDILPRENASGYKVTSIVIPEGVTEIQTGALMAFDELTSISLPSTLTTIGEFAIGMNPSLMSVTIPTNVTEVRTEFITAMSNSASVTLLPTTPPSGIESCIFQDDTWQQGTYTIYVPSASLTTYQNTCFMVTSSRFQAIV